MKNEKSGTNLKRRGFLLAGSIGTAGAVAAVVAPTLQQVVPVAAVPPITGDVGYHDSQHVRTYYELARV